MTTYYRALLCVCVPQGGFRNEPYGLPTSPTYHLQPSNLPPTTYDLRRMQTALPSCLRVSACGALVLAGKHRPRAGLAADARSAAIVEQIVGNPFIQDVAAEISPLVQAAKGSILIRPNFSCPTVPGGYPPGWGSDRGGFPVAQASKRPPPWCRTRILLIEAAAIGIAVVAAGPAVNALVVLERRDLVCSKMQSSSHTYPRSAPEFERFRELIARIQIEHVYSRLDPGRAWRS